MIKGERYALELLQIETARAYACSRHYYELWARTVYPENQMLWTRTIGPENKMRGAVWVAERLHNLACYWQIAAELQSEHVRRLLGITP